MIFADVARAVVVLGMLACERHGQHLGDLRAAAAGDARVGVLRARAQRGGAEHLVSNKDDVLLPTRSGRPRGHLTWRSGSALGGVIAAVFGRNAVFVLNAVSFLVSAFLLTRMQVQRAAYAGSVPLKARDLMDFSPIPRRLPLHSARSAAARDAVAKFGLGLMGAHYVCCRCSANASSPCTSAILARAAPGCSA